MNKVVKKVEDLQISFDDFSKDYIIWSKISDIIFEQHINILKYMDICLISIECVSLVLAVIFKICNIEILRHICTGIILGCTLGVGICSIVTNKFWERAKKNFNDFFPYIKKNLKMGEHNNEKDI